MSAGSTRAAPTEDCDIIMKGGITSGVVYPLAACHLAQRYRFRQVGGASAGAIAAAFVAAAEVGRSRDRSDPDIGFHTLATLPDELGVELEHLFQPSPGTSAAYAMLSTAIEPGLGVWRKCWRILIRLVRATWVQSLLYGILLAGIGLLLSWLLVGLWLDGSTSAVLAAALLWLPLTLLFVLALDAVGFAKRTLSAIERNGFGLCDGHTSSGGGHLPLTDWMTDRLDQIAGRATTGAPLTIGDLWGPEAVEAFTQAVAPTSAFLDLVPYRRRAVAATRLVDLETMTTNLTLRRPYRFPFESRVFSFCATCLAQYFPDRVVRHLAAHGPEVPDGEDPAVSMMCPRHPDVRVHAFPAPPHVPVVVAARISLSFPGLISALPLCYVDFARATGHVALVQVWFSDGGIASNFPMHLFDNLWPSRPTFGINLQPRTDEHGAADAVIPRSPMPRSQHDPSLSAFVHSILDTMQNWSDVTQLTLPAYRSRVAELRLADDEGGMNLRMPPNLITRIAHRARPRQPCSTTSTCLRTSCGALKHRWRRSTTCSKGSHTGARPWLRLGDRRLGSGAPKERSDRAANTR